MKEGKIHRRKRERGDRERTVVDANWELSPNPVLLITCLFSAIQGQLPLPLPCPSGDRRPTCPRIHLQEKAEEKGQSEGEGQSKGRLKEDPPDRVGRANHLDRGHSGSCRDIIKVSGINSNT